MSVNAARGRSFLNFFENTVVHEHDFDGWEFGKGALSELRFCGVAVKRKKVKAKVEAKGMRVMSRE